MLVCTDRFGYACAHWPGGGQQLQSLHLHRGFEHRRHRQPGGAPSVHRPGDGHLRRCRPALALCSQHPLRGNHRHKPQTRPPRRSCLRQERQPLHRRFKQQLRARDRWNGDCADCGWAVRQRQHRQFGHGPEQSLRAGLHVQRLAVHLGVGGDPEQCGELQLRHQRADLHRRPLQRCLRRVQRLAGGPGCIAGPPQPAARRHHRHRRQHLSGRFAEQHCAQAGHQPEPSRQPMSDRSVRARPSSSASIRR